MNRYIIQQVYLIKRLTYGTTVLGTTVPSTGIDTVTVVSPTGASTYNSYIPFLRQRGEASAGGCLGTSMASNGLNLAKLRGLVY